MLHNRHRDLPLIRSLYKSGLVSILLVSSVFSLASSAPPRNGRILFRHGLSGTHFAPEVHDRLRRGLAEQHIKLGRNLLQAQNFSALQIVSLGKHVGVDMLEVPEEVAYDWVLEELKNHPEIEFAEEDKLVSAYTTPNDPGVTQQWALYQLGLFTDSPLENGLVEQGAWNRTYGGDVIVCIIDSGVDYTHPDLASNIWTNKDEIPDNGIDDDDNGYIDDYHGINVMTISGDAMDDNFHGTHLSGMVGAVCNNNLGICGISPVVKVMGCKFLDSKGNGYTSDAVKCLDYSLQQGVDITLNSYGGLNADSDALKTAITAANKAGQLFVTAAGNDYGTDIDATPTFPAAYQMPNIISVISTNESGQLAPFSNYGAKLADIAAPGTHILSTVLKGEYSEHDGTSQSAGYIAGAAALLLAAHRQAGFENATGAQMKELLMKGARRLPDLEGTCKTGGMLDVAASMSLVPLYAQSPQDNGSWIMNALAPPPPGSRSQPSPTPASMGLFGSFWGMPNAVAQAPPSSRAPTGFRPDLLLPPGLRPYQDLSSKSARRGRGKSTAVKIPAADTRVKSIAQEFRNNSGLEHTALSFIMHNTGAFSTCLEAGLTDLPSTPLAGLDITEGVIAGNGAGYVVNLEGGAFVGTLLVKSLLVTPYGDIRLFNISLPEHPAQAPGNDSALANFFQVRRISALGYNRKLVKNGTILLQMRPDRIAVTYRNVTFEGETAGSSFQVEIFRGGRTLRAGSFRLSWLSVGATSGTLGLSGDRPADTGGPDLFASGACPRPATLAVEFVTSQDSPAVHKPSDLHSVKLTNTGNLVLNVGLDVLPAGKSILPEGGCVSPLQKDAPAQAWTMSAPQDNPIIRASRAAAELPCSQATDQPTYDNITRTAIVQYTQKLSLPLRIIGAFSRRNSCAMQWLVLSTASAFPDSFGDNTTVWFVMSPQRKYLLVGGETLKTKEACADYGPNVFNITMDGNAIIFRDDQCGRIVAQHSLGDRPLYLHTAMTSLPKCRGSDMKWEHLEVLEKITIAPIRVNSSVATVTSSLVPASPAHPSAAAPALPSRLQSHLPSHLEVESASVGQLTAKSVLPMDAAGPLPFPGTQASKAGSFRLLLRRRPQLHPPAGSAGAPTPSTQAVAPAPEEGGEDGDDFPWVPVPGTLKKQSVSTFPSEQAYLQTSVSWVSLTQRSVVIPPGGSIVVGVNINSTGLRTGPSSAILVLRSNDPERPVMRAPLQQVAA